MMALLLAASVWTAPVTVPQDAGPWAAAPLPAWLEQRTEGDLSRVLLEDEAGHEVPYLVRDTASTPSTAWRAADVRNRLRTDRGWVLEIQLEPGQAVDGVRLQVEGDEGVLEGRLLAGRDGEIHGVVADDLRLGVLGSTAVLAATVPAVDLPRLRLELETVISGLTPVGAQIRPVAGPLRPRGRPPLTLRASREPSTASTSRWGLRPAGPLQRIDAIRLTVTAPSVFRRPVRVEAFTGDGWTAVGAAVVERIPLADGRDGLEQLEVPLTPGVYPRLRLSEEHGGERPLQLEQAAGRVRPRWIAFPAEGHELQLVASRQPRTRTLEARQPALDLRRLAEATVGVLEAGDEGVEADDRVGGRLTTSLLFLAAAVLLALLAWRALAERT